MIQAATRHIIFLLIIIQLIAALAVSAAIEPRPGSDSSRWSGKGKHKQQAGPTPGFTGGSGLDNNNVYWCDSESLPGCQACPDGSRCTACWTQYPNATGSRFVLNPFTGQCECPPGYGLLPNLPPPTWSGRHLLTDPEPMLPAIPIATVTETQAMLAAAQYPDQASLQSAQPGLFLPDPLPSWAINCLPCPVNYYSAGGQQGFARCKPCPGTFTTAWATAASNCLFPYCGPGQEPSRRTGRCRLCPIGTYSSATANNQQCYACPSGTTTAAAGSKSYTDCRVPVCSPGQELDLDLLVCNACIGNTISPGGIKSQGTAQPRCQECPYGTAANQTRTVCNSGVCPAPESFSITCRTDNLLNQTSYFPCGPNGKPVPIWQYCTAYPPGAQLGLYNLTSGGLATPEIACPAGAYSSNVFYPTIISFMGRTDCLCNAGVSCWFVSGPTSTVNYYGGTAASRVILRPTLTVPDPQLDSLNSLVQSMAGTNDTRAYYAVSQVATRSGYCRQQPSVLLTVQAGSTATLNWTNPLQVNCSSQGYITRVAMQPDLTWSFSSNGSLPSATTLKGLSKLQMLTCVNCGLDGTLPRDWGTETSLMELRVLDFTGNNFTGTLPETWGYMTNLAELTLSSWNASSLGIIPSAWGYMRSLTFVNLTGAYLDTDNASCAPWQWQYVNGLVPNQTFLPPATYRNMTFCSPPS